MIKRSANFLFVSSLLASAIALAAEAPDTNKDLIKRGEYLATAADCIACHTGENAAPFSGGYAIDSPYGTIYGTNITPDKTYGIGNYTSDDLYRVLTEGKRADGHNLYPAMPYTSYQFISREDSDAIYAYLMSVEPIARPAPETNLGFPYGIRMGLSAWNLLYKSRIDLKDTDGKSEEYKRGQYLVDVLGHCGECHTPRDALGGLKMGEYMEGAVLGDYMAPSLVSEDLINRGWNKEDLSQFLGHAVSPQGSAYNEMNKVFTHSTQHLTDDDLNAISTYLLGDEPMQPNIIEMAAFDSLTESAQKGRQEYLNTCAGCHGVEGQGIPNATVAMSLNTTLMLSDPLNLTRVILDGTSGATHTGFNKMQAMPGYKDKISDESLTDMVNYLRQTWGGITDDVTVDEIKAITEN